MAVYSVSSVLCFVCAACEKLPNLVNRTDQRAEARTLQLARTRGLKRSPSSGKPTLLAFPGAAVGWDVVGLKLEVVLALKERRVRAHPIT